MRRSKSARIFNLEEIVLQWVDENSNTGCRKIAFEQGTVTLRNHVGNHCYYPYHVTFPHTDDTFATRLWRVSLHASEFQPRNLSKYVPLFSCNLKQYDPTRMGKQPKSVLLLFQSNWESTFQFAISFLYTIHLLFNQAAFTFIVTRRSIVWCLMNVISRYRLFSDMAMLSCVAAFSLMTAFANCESILMTEVFVIPIRPETFDWSGDGKKGKKKKGYSIMNNDTDERLFAHRLYCVRIAETIRLRAGAMMKRRAYRNNRAERARSRER